MNKMNIGSGKDYRTGWVNVEINRRFKADIYCDIMDFEPQRQIEGFKGFDEVLAKDVLDHITNADCLKLLGRITTWLNKNGVLFIHLPNFETCSVRAVEGDHEALCWVYGSDGSRASYETNVIRWGYTPESMGQMLVDAGLEVIDTRETCEGYGFMMIAMKRE